MAVFQRSPPRRKIDVFCALLGSAGILNYIAELHSVCRLNLTDLQRRLPESMCVQTSAGGTLAWIDISSTGLTDVQLREQWMSKGVGLVTGNVFFWGSIKNERFVRIALARGRDYFAEALDRIVGARFFREGGACVAVERRCSKR